MKKDKIKLSVKDRKLELAVSQYELGRLATEKSSAAASKPKRGYARLYPEQILRADEGCGFGFLKGH